MEYTTAIGLLFLFVLMFVAGLAFMFLYPKELLGLIGTIMLLPLGITALVLLIFFLREKTAKPEEAELVAFEGGKKRK